VCACVLKQRGGIHEYQKSSSSSSSSSSSISSSSSELEVLVVVNVAQHKRVLKQHGVEYYTRFLCEVHNFIFSFMTYMIFC